MFFHLFYFSIAIRFILADIDDKNCTVNSLGKVFDKSAVMCEDKANEAFCTNVFGASVVAGGIINRKEWCIGKGITTIDDIKNGAIALCPKTCGLCCQTPEYNCKDSGKNLDCDTVTQAQCKDPKWREILAAECPSKCGFCLEGGCVDAAIECGNDPSICRNIDSLEFAMKNCKKTCGYCDLLTTTSSEGITGYAEIQTDVQNTAECIDTSNSCAAWKKSGFCTSTFYTTENKLQFCAKTCELC